MSETPATPAVAVVVVTWNSAAVLGPMLDSLQEDAPPEGLEVVVVDNGSTDGTAGIVRDHALRPRLIANGANRGLAAANNQGIAASSAPFVVIANPDTEVRPGALEALVAAAGRHPRAAMVVPRLRYGDGAPQTSAGDLPTLAEALLGRRSRRREEGGAAGFWWDGWDHGTERRIGRGQEAFYLVRREAMDEIGPQDEEFKLDWEGVDWAARATEAGWEIWFTPEATVVHHTGASIRQVPLRWIVGSHRGMYRYFAKRSSRPLRPLLAAAIASRGAAKALATAAGSVSYERSNRG